MEIIRSYAFVTFSTIKDASKAYEKMHHFTLDDGRELHVEYVTANRMGRRQPRERESRFGYRRRSPRRYSSVSPSRRRIVRSRSSSLERQYKRRRLVGYRMSSERRYHIGKNGSDRSSPLRERSPSYPVRERLRNARRSPVRSVQRREPSDRDERTLRRRETTEGNRELPSERRSTLYSHVRASPGRPRTRVESPFSRRDNDGREPERRRSISPRDPEYPRRREKISVPEGSRREGFREADKTSLTNHNGDREARTSPDDYYDRRHSFRHSRAYEERDFQRRDRLSTENRHARERRSVEGRIR